jgi:beta-phosphoglucomutase-like phosphatase (HAD superfamily)
VTAAPALVIFDCDGVLVDSEPLSTSVLAASLTAAGLPTSSGDALRDYKGKLLREVTGHAGRLLGAPLPEDFLENFEREREQAFRASLEAVPGARQAVEAVKAAGVAVCVASQGKRSKTELNALADGLA